MKAGYATRRPPILLKSRQNPEIFIEIFEWKSQEAIAKAHQDPKVRAFWSEFDRLCTTVGLELKDLPEATQPFPNFEPLDVY